MRRIFYGALITTTYTYWEYLMITLYDSLILHLLPIFTLGIALSVLWHVGVESNIEQCINCTENKA